MFIVKHALSVWSMLPTAIESHVATTAIRNDASADTARSSADKHCTNFRHVRNASAATRSPPRPADAANAGWAPSPPRRLEVDARTRSGRRLNKSTIPPCCAPRAARRRAFRSAARNADSIASSVHTCALRTADSSEHSHTLQRLDTWRAARSTAVRLPHPADPETRIVVRRRCQRRWWSWRPPRCVESPAAEDLPLPAVG